MSRNGTKEVSSKRVMKKERIEIPLKFLSKFWKVILVIILFWVNHGKKFELVLKERQLNGLTSPKLKVDYIDWFYRTKFAKMTGKKHPKFSKKLKLKCFAY